MILTILLSLNIVFFSLLITGFFLDRMIRFRLLFLSVNIFLLVVLFLLAGSVLLT